MSAITDVSPKQACVEYERLLIQLHQRIQAGTNEEPEADSLYEAMDVCYAPLNLEEIRLMNGLSADLYMLQDEEIFALSAEMSLEEIISVLQDKEVFDFDMFTPLEAIRNQATLTRAEQMSLAKKAFSMRFEEAIRDGEWARALTLLRTGKVTTAKYQLAVWRAILYDLLGHAEASEQFRDYAKQISSQEPLQEALLVGALS